MKKLFFCLITLVTIFVAHYASTYLHEWMHGTVAWMFGYKSSPFAIHYPSDWIFLLDIDEAVNYEKVFGDQRFGVGAAIAIAPVCMGAILFLLGLYWLRSQRMQQAKWLYGFLYWFTLANLGQVFAYIPTRTFSRSADIANFLHGTGLSPWVVAIPGTLFVLWGMVRWFSQEMPRAFEVFSIEKKWGRRAFLLATLLVLFGFFGAAGFTQPDVVANRFSMISWGLIPVLFWWISAREKKS